MENSGDLYVASIRSDDGWGLYKVDKDVYAYIRQLEGYIKNPKQSQLLLLYPHLAPHWPPKEEV